MSPPSKTAVARAAERGLRYGIVAVLAVGLRRRQASAIVNALGALLASYPPPSSNADTAWRSGRGSGSTPPAPV